MKAAVVALLSELDDVLLSKEEQRMGLKAFLNGNSVFALLFTGFGKSFMELHGVVTLALSPTRLLLPGE